MENNTFYSRQFLNDTKGLATAECEIELTSWMLEGVIRLSDCSRSIHLDFSCYEIEDLVEANNKINRLLFIFNKFKSNFDRLSQEFIDTADERKEKNSVKV